MAYRGRVFVSFDGDTDIHYYRLMCAWKQSDNTDFSFSNAHDLAQCRDTSLESTIKRSLSERLATSGTVISLIGERTRYLNKFVRWELEQAVQRNIPIIGVNLNGRRTQDLDRCPPVIRDELVVYVSFQARIIQHALEHWPNEYQQLATKGISGPRYYGADVYDGLGL